MNVQEMISSAEEALGWPYVSPGTNDARGIDCSGLFVKIYQDQSKKIYHGSNRIYRVYCSEKGKLNSVSQLKPGYAVFKWKNQQPSGYSDNLGDFSHIGLVVSVNPLRIIHASSAAGCVTTDTKINKWSYWGKLKDVDCGGDKMNKTNESIDTSEAYETGVVFAVTGTSVKMRAKPSTSCAQYHDIPIGTEVEILEYKDDWCKIKALGREGYMMTHFIKTDKIPDQINDADERIIVSKNDLNQVYQNLEKALGQFLVDKKNLENTYDIIGDMLGLRG